MITLFKHHIFKFILLAVLSLKVCVFVADNLSILSDTPTASHIVLDDFENENEENKEVDESEKINQSMYPNASESSYIIDKNLSIHIIENYRIQYLEYTTPPPEFS